MGARKPFAFIELRVRNNQAKPRQRGLSLMSDWGLGLSRTRDLLQTAGEYLDFGKIATGTARLYDESVLTEKLALYRKHQVRPYLGGQFMEYVFATQGEKALGGFLDEARRVGFEVAEISDNYVTLSQDERRRQIQMVKDSGLAAFAEVGSKTDQNDPSALISQAQAALAAGAEMVLVEGAELVQDDQVDHQMLKALSSELDVDKIMFELSTIRIGSTLPAIHNLKKLLIKEIGPEVNLANLSPDEIMETESLRVGLGVVGPKERSV